MCSLLDLPIVLWNIAVSTCFVLDKFSANHVIPMKEEFNNKLKCLVGRKKSNSLYFINTVRYQDFIKEVKEIKTKRNKTFEDYKMLASYDILDVNGRERLIQPRTEVNSSIKFYVSMEDLFSVLHTIHLLFKHANKDMMDAELKTKFCNVSKEVIKIYLTCCQTCMESK